MMSRELPSAARAGGHLEIETAQMLSLTSYHHDDILSASTLTGARR
jgi:hypothetical protein